MSAGVLPTFAGRCQCRAAGCAALQIIGRRCPAGNRSPAQWQEVDLMPVRTLPRNSQSSSLATCSCAVWDSTMLHCFRAIKMAEQR